jgi:hypothetical protein
MGLKGCRLWVMGQLDSTCRAPPRAALLVLLVILATLRLGIRLGLLGGGRRRVQNLLGVAVRVEFVKAKL